MYIKLFRVKSVSMRSVMRLVVLLFAVFPASHAALGHSGGLDGLGCHYDRNSVHYHCHRGQLTGQLFESKAEAVKAFQGTKTLAKSPARVSVIGRSSVVDADTIEIHGQRIRLFGIDAPESTQFCLA